MIANTAPRKIGSMMGLQSKHAGNAPADASEFPSIWVVEDLTSA
jgi:hypothetical protein